MTKPNKPDPEQLAELRAQLTAARLDAEAATALHAGGCISVELFLPHAAARLALLDDGRVCTKDPCDGAPMEGTTAAAAVDDLRRQYPRFFSRR